MTHITAIEIKNYQGIRAVRYAFPRSGAVLEGRNGGGKTSAIEAIRTGLCAAGIDKSAILKGEDECEILIDLDSATVRRRINAAGKGSLRVTRSDGTTATSPADFLLRLVGVSPLDPLALIERAKTEDDRRKRAASVLAAFPATVTAEQLGRWAPSVELVSVLGRDDDGKIDVAGHGLTVLSRVREKAYDLRTIANRAEKDATTELERALAEEERLRVAAGIEPGAVYEVPDLGALRARETEAVGALAVARNERANRSQVEAEATSRRERVAKLRADAVAMREALPEVPDAPSETTIAALRKALDEAEAAVEEAIRVRDRAEEEWREADHEASERARVEAARKRESEDADQLDERAAELEATIASPGASSDEGAVESAEKVLADARAELFRADGLRAHATAATKTSDAREAERRRKAAAKVLDDEVAFLTNEAPSKLMTEAGSIPGLVVDGTDIRLDGVSIDRLSGKEKLAFAVEIARRANAKSRILVIDGLERVDPEQLEGFLEMCTADGFQLVATRVAAGPVKLVPIDEVAK